MKAKTKILIVEDDIPLALLMVNVLTRAGCDVQAAGNAKKALCLALAENFDLITLDVHMPRTDGFYICKRLKLIPHLKSTPVIFVSGGASKEEQQRAIELGAVDFISKPFEVTDFIFRIISHVKQAGNALQVTN